MKKTIFALAAAATIAVGTLSPTPADAQRRGVGLGLGILGGVVVGTIIGSAIATTPATTYDDYYGDAPYDCRGYWARRRGATRTATSITAARNISAIRLRVTAGSHHRIRRGCLGGRGVAVFDAASHHRMWSSTAAVGQQSTFSPFFF